MAYVYKVSALTIAAEVAANSSISIFENSNMGRKSALAAQYLLEIPCYTSRFNSTK
jgi:hypothetical protein